MVNYSYVVCVPTNTPENSSYKEKVEIRNDTILGILVYIPSGHNGATGVRIKYGPKQIMPSEPSSWIKGDNIAVHSTGPIRLPEKPVRLTVECFNNSSNYEHCFYIYIDAIDWEDYPWGGRLDKMIELLNKLVAINEQAYTNMGVYQPPAKEKKRKKREIISKTESIIEKIRSILRGE